MDKVYDICCGIDMHQKLIVACLRKGNKSMILFDNYKVSRLNAILLILHQHFSGRNPQSPLTILR